MKTFTQLITEVKSGPFKSKAIGSKVKVYGQDSFGNSDHSGKTGTVVAAYRTPTFSQMHPWVVEYSIEFEHGTKGTYRREGTRKVK